MNALPSYVCEVCGSQVADHRRWLLLPAQVPAGGETLEILSWDDELASRPGMSHLCCAEHAQQLISAWIAPRPDSHKHLPRLRRRVAPETAEQEASALLGEIALDGIAAGGVEQDWRSLEMVLDAIETVLQSPTSGDDEEEALLCDA